MVVGKKFAWLGMLGAIGSPLSAQDHVFDTEGYRTSHYRGPVRHAPEGAPRIAASAIATLNPTRDVLLIDVLPAEGGQRQDDGTWRLAQPHNSLPGAHWFPEVGRGTPPPAIAAAFAQSVSRLTQGRKNRMIVTFCLADCWMGWNAARRLRKMGYTNIWWFAEGTDGWSSLGHPLVPAAPER
ncbi:MAG: rhodanese-like domain-containing protein [Sphingobium sp.]|uniref:rhodanese-like domain-containing protein n=1 Tax=Sphingobium sp. CECT 9361 TaxID=2845384 RepID=UPI001E5E605D|nr:rhodanese-like domain-containing protein [Sphingobium sp. CECT 9361]CAH0355792.1 hypothetical protein SPH9361_03709 [Sphingobium sp. CECT 9361]